MYDRKKITLFVLLIATVILGGVSLFLATQINNNQSPDDSQAGTNICKAVDASNPDTVTFCTSLSATTCGGYPACQLVFVPTMCTHSGTQYSENSLRCAGYDQLKCTSSGQWVASGCCNDGVQNSDGSCSAPPAACPTDPACPTGSSRITLEGANRCRCLCNNGNVVNAGGSCTTGSTSGGTASCSQNGEIISHGNTACIDGTNYTCSNGTATPGSSCGTEPGTTTGGTTGGTCTPEAPTKAKLLSPLKDAVVNTITVTLSWDKNGTFGKACPTNTNKYRVKLLAVGLNEACPTSSLDVPNLEGHIEGGTGEDGLFSYQINVQDDTKYCWAIRKNNGDTAADTAVRSFTVNIEETNPTTGGGGDDGTGTTTSAPVDETTTGGNNTTTTTGGTVAGSVASVSDELPETAIVSDELDPIILGMILVIIGLTLYKFDFGRKVEVE